MQEFRQAVAPQNLGPSWAPWPIFPAGAIPRECLKPETRWRRAQAAANPSLEFSNANEDRYQPVDAFAVVDGGQTDAAGSSIQVLESLMKRLYSIPSLGSLKYTSTIVTDGVSNGNFLRDARSAETSDTLLLPVITNGIPQ